MRIRFSAIDCKMPGKIKNGRVIVMNGTTYNSAIEYHCVPQYVRIGPYLRKCMDNSEWSGEEPRCECKSYYVILPKKISSCLFQ